MKKTFSPYRPLLIMFVVFLILLGLIYVAVTNLIKTQSELSIRRDEVEKLQKKYAVLESNKALTKTQITNYNNLLTKLIPNTEDYFSILFALEQLSTQTGFFISRYTIQLSESSPEKLNVTVEGDGDSEAFLSFLKDYPFGGGRLITNESMEFESEVIGQIKLNLSFYNKQADTNSDTLVELKPEQIALMNEIQNKTTFAFKEDIPDIVDYKVKENPF